MQIFSNAAALLRFTLLAMKTSFVCFAIIASAFTTITTASAADPAAPKKEKPLTPGGIYRQGDMQRPRPTVITPPAAGTPEKPGMPPSDAAVLFDGTDLSRWERDIPKNDAQPDDKTPKWTIKDGFMECAPFSGTIHCKDHFGSAQLHLEWATPSEVKGNSQGRGNSGVLLSGWGEVQVLDSFENDTYPDGQAGALYSQYPPLVNTCRKPGEWQTYDIILQCAKLKDDGSVETPALITVLHNGVVVQHAVKQDHKLQEWTFALQDHHNPVRYRNIWIRPLHRYDENAAK